MGCCRARQANNPRLCHSLFRLCFDFKDADHGDGHGVGASEPPEDCGAVNAREGGHCFWVEIEPGHEPIKMLGAGVDGGLGFHAAAFQ